MEGQGNFYQIIIMLFSIKNTKIFLIYVLFGFGGIWHLLGKFENLMSMLASPFIIAISLLLLFDVLNTIAKRSKICFLVWSSIILFVGWIIEFIGTNYHFPFGIYHYGHTLKPQILHVPLAIGFAWLEICLSSLIITMIINNA